MAQPYALLTLAEAAAKARLSTKTLCRAIMAGELVASKLGGRWRIRGVDFDSWVEARRYVPAVDVVYPIAPAAPVEVGSLEALRRIEAA